MIRVRVDNGKYTFEHDRVARIFRHGELWVDVPHGPNAIYCIMCELDAARVVIAAARALRDRLGVHCPPEILMALDIHTKLVDDREPPTEWATK